MKIFTKYNSFERCGENGNKIDVEIMKWEPFSVKWSKTILQAHSMEPCWKYCIVLWYHHVHLTIDNRSVSVWRGIVHRSMVTALRVCIFFFLLFVVKGLPVQYLSNHFEATFTTSSQDIMVLKYIQTNSLYCPICEKCQF